MGKYRIYRKSDKFVWTRSRIILTITILTLLIYGIEDLINNSIPDNLFNKIIGYLMSIALLAGVINNFFREQLKGKLEGLIVFENDSIKIDEEIIYLDEIRLITFSGLDYVDMIITRNFPNGLFSSGVNNRVTIIFNSGKVITTYFQRNNEFDMRKIIKELTHYYDEGKMIKQNYLNTINARVF